MQGMYVAMVFFITQDMLANGNCSWYSTTTPALIVIALFCHVIIGNNLLVILVYANQDWNNQLSFIKYNYYILSN